MKARDAGADSNPAQLEEEEEEEEEQKKFYFAGSTEGVRTFSTRYSKITDVLFTLGELVLFLATCRKFAYS